MTNQPARRIFLPSDIAIVGMACRFPGANNYNEFWENLKNGVNSIKEVTPDRWDLKEFYSPNPKENENKSYCKWLGMIDDVDKFDAPFFNISPREAEHMDPQQRILLEETYHCLEDAGIPLRIFRNEITSVYVGAEAQDYFQKVTNDNSIIEAQSGTGNYECVMANRISYFFDLKGESKTVNNACASTHFALHDAFQSLKMGDSQFSLVGSATLQLSPWKEISFSKARMLSPDGQCKTFDSTANGYVPGEGAGVLLLTTLENAKKYHCFIYGIVDAVSLNHVGRSVSLTAPKVEAQKNVILKALKEANLSSDQITYIEAHGTGTSLGDPIEIEALTKVFNENRHNSIRKNKCIVGSVKTNIGHLEATAGMAGLIKVLLMLKHKQIPPTLNLKNVNPMIDFENSPFIPALKLSNWKVSQNQKRIAGISSFGFGGANAHIIIEEYIETAVKNKITSKNKPSKKPNVFIFSAKSKDSLVKLVNSWRMFVSQKDFLKLDLNQISYSLCQREQYEFRFGFLAKTHKEIYEKIKSFSEIQIASDNFKNKFNVLNIPDINSKKVKKEFEYYEYLIKAGIKPHLITGSGNGYFLALALSKAIKKTDLAKLIKSRSLKGIKVRRPEINIYDPFNKNFIQTQYLTADKLNELLVTIEINQNSYQALVAKCLDLIRNQFTFKKLIEGWDKELKKYSLTMSTLLQSKENDKQYLCTTILINCLDSLNKKWTLSRQFESFSIQQEKILRMLEQKIIFSHELIACFLSQTEKSHNDLLVDINNRFLVSFYTHQLEKEKFNYDLYFKNNNIQINHSLEEIIKTFIKNESLVVKQIDIQKDIFTVCLNQWLHGFEIDWQLLHQGKDVRRVSLPTYPFAKERYWITSGGSKVNQGLSAELREEIKKILDKVEQGELELEEVKTLRARLVGDNDSSHVVSGNKEKNNIADKEIKREEVLLSCDWREEAGVLGEKKEGKIKEIKSINEFREMNNQGLEENMIIIDLLDINGDETSTFERIKEYQKLVEKNYQTGFSVIQFGLEGHEQSQIIQGLMRVLGAEYGKVVSKCVMFDVEPSESVLRETLDKETKIDDEINVIRYVGGKRSVPDVQKLKANEEKKVEINIQADKAYVITGGVRGIGAEVAKYLVSRGARKLVLMGQSKLSSRDVWETVLEKNENRQEIEKIKLIKWIEEQGVKVMLSSAKLSDEDQISELRKQIDVEFGEVAGLVHSAGLVNNDNPAFYKKEIETISKVLDPKVEGTKVLSKVFGEKSLDFFIVFSSVSGIFPSLGAGVSDYAIANSYLDYFVEQKHREGKTFYKSISWGSWKEIGMGEVDSHRYRNLGLISHTTQEGLKLFERILNLNGFNHFIGFVTDKKLIDEKNLLKQKQEVRQIDTNKPETRERQMVASGASLSVINKIKEIFSSELKISIEKLNVEKNFSDLGVDSIILAELTKKIERELNANFDPSLLMEYQTITKLAGYMAEKYGDKFLRVEQKKMVAIEETNLAGAELEKQKVEIKKEHTNVYKGQQKIAVIGIACRFPGARDKEEYWNNLKNGVSSICEIPENRWKVNDFYSSEYLPGKSISKWGGFVDDIEMFDAKFFNVKEDTAKHMDPLQRLFLESSYEALLDAGYSKDEISNRKIGVYVGSRVSNYASYIDEPKKETVVGLGQNFIAAQISDYLNIHGPNLVVDTACSSSLVSIHLACQSLMTGESEMAIAGGVDVLLDEKPYIVLSQGKALSPDGKCHTFDQKANGFVPGEGSGAVILKLLDDAISAGDRIYAVIDAVAVNNDGHTMGITTPNMDAQKAVISEALEKAQINPETISYVETHGTGTMIGDPIELKALTQVYRDYTDKNQFCAVGSVKTNFGHLLSAAGIASFIKVALSIYHKQIPPTLNCETPNTRFAFNDSPFYPGTKLSDWDKEIRRATISSFGFGGTNAHLIMENLDQENVNIKRNSLPKPKYQKQKYWINKGRAEVQIVSSSHEPRPILEIKKQSGVGQKEIFEFEILDGDYITRDHIVHSTGLIPGVTYLDLIYRCLSAKGIDAGRVEIRNVLFKEPVATSEQFDKRIEVVFENASKDDEQQKYKVNIQSQKFRAQNQLSDTWDQNTEATVLVHGHSALKDRQLDIAGLISKAEKRYEMDELYANVRKIDIVHKDFMKALGKVYVGKDFILAKLELGELASGYRDKFYIHSVYLDSSTLLPFLSLENSQVGEKKAYIPMSIKKFVSAKHFGKDVYAYVKLNENQLSDFCARDVYVNDIEYFDGEGKFLALAEELSAKQIRNLELIQRLLKSTAIDVLPTIVKNTRKIKKKVMKKVTAGGNTLETVKTYIEEPLNRKLEDKELELGFYDLGLESSHLLVVSKKLEELIGQELYPTLLFEYPNVKALAGYFEENFFSKFGNSTEFKEVEQEIEVDEEYFEETPVVLGQFKNTINPDVENVLSDEHKEDDIAIVGIAGHYPEANDLYEFWENIKHGKNCIKEVPIDHWNAQGFYEDNKKPTPNKTYSKWGGFINDADKFDPLFFRISPLEAEQLDPQTRLMLETAWETIEDAGYTPTELNKNKVGVYVGVMNADYAWIAAEAMGKTGQYLSPGFYAHEIANRISNFMNFQGPSLAIQTACSSSLTAIHMARKAILNGECKAAIAGGVNLSLHPSKYVMLSQMGILSPEGKEKTFDEKADGYVPGEGVGVVLLKKLSDAIKEGDQIHGVIKGSAVNHSGMGGGHHVPGVKQLSEVFEESLLESKININKFKYIETHGTGTNLGDPIEISALNNVVKKYSQEKNFIELGSKSNLGHLESASGICSLTKVLLAMRNNEIPKCVNIENENTKLNLKNSAFKIPTITKQWTTEQKVAGINSFGVGGSNAFIVVANYPQKRIVCSQKPELIFISAKNENRLKDYVKKLSLYLERELAKNEKDRVSLSDVAYTLQIGREKFEERVAIVCESLEEFNFQLKNLFVEIISNGFDVYEEVGKSDKALLNCFRGNIKKEKVNISPTQKRILEAVILEIESKNIDLNRFKDNLLILAENFTKGFEIDWQLLHQGKDVRRVSLPTYPFEKKRYWIPMTSGQGVSNHTNGLVGNVSKLHPMVDVNDSTLEEQAFCKSLSSKEFFLKDHVVGDFCVLPGVGYLEMARASGNLASKSRQVTNIKNVIWAKPIAVNGIPELARVVLEPKDGMKLVSYSVSTGEGLHSQGELVYTDSSSQLSRPISRKLDIQSIKVNCDKVISKSNLYKRFESIGLKYGPTFQSIEEINVNGVEAVSRLKLNQSIKDTIKEFELHPSLMDAALQTTAGILFANNPDNKGLALPFALSELIIHKSFTEECYVHAKVSEDKGSTKKFDIDVTDLEGNLIVEFKGFAVREMSPDALKGLGTKKVLAQIEGSVQAGKGSTSTELAPTPNESIYYGTEWVEAEISNAQRGEVSSIYKAYAGNEVMVVVGKKGTLEDLAVNEDGGSKVIRIEFGTEFKQADTNHYEVQADNEADYVKLVGAIKGSGKEIKDIIYVTQEATDLTKTSEVQNKVNSSLSSVFLLTKALINSKPKNKVKLLYIHSGDLIDESVSGIAKTVRLENPKFEYRVIKQGTNADLIKIIINELLDETSKAVEIRYNNRQRQEKRVVQLEESEATTGNATNNTQVLKNLKQNGVYLITGGAGGLGLIFAEYLAKTYQAKVILSGRSILTEEKQEKIQELTNKYQTTIEYSAKDITDTKQANELLKEIREKYQTLDGVIHAAGVIKDAFILKKEFSQFKEVLTPKISGTINILNAIKEQGLAPQHIILFSSVASVMGNLGQCDYASGNSFMNALAERNQDTLPTTDSSSTKVVSICWPLWREGGMHIDATSEQMMKSTTGMVPLEMEKGIKALEDALSNSNTNTKHSQFIVFDGLKEKVQKTLNIKTKNNYEKVDMLVNEKQQAITGIAISNSEIETDLIKIVCELLKVSEKDIDVDVDFAEYGVDSILMMSILNQLEKYCGKAVEPGVVIENATIKKLSNYLAENGYVSGKEIGKKEERLEEIKVTNKEIPVEMIPKKIRNRFIKQNNNSNPQSKKIAVVSVSGRFPKSKDIEEYWNHLKEAKDLISEVPKDRFDINEYFDTDRSAEGKSYSKWAGFMDGVYDFDNEYFGINEIDATGMDPQHRILLELAQELFDRGGYAKTELKKQKVGVFIGGADSNYIKDNENLLEDSHRQHMVVNMIQNMMAARISDFYDLKGPSMTVDTACSSALLAIHNACQSIMAGESEMAIAGGMQIVIDPQTFVAFSKAQTLSSDSKSYVFDEKANGFVLGEGAGLVLLKPLEKAEADGDQILGVILGSAVNNDGHTMGLTTPNIDAQKEVIKEAVRKAEIDPSTITYLEAHGTGTLLGDPIEIKAATQVYQEFTDKKQYVAVGSVKSNIGHLLRAAGSASFIKVILSMQHKLIPATLNCDKPHPRFKFEESPFYPNVKTKEWDLPSGLDVRRAGISSFGFGGTNVHMILEEYNPDKCGYIQKRKPLPLTLFNRRSFRLGKTVQKVGNHFEVEQKSSKFLMDLLAQVEAGAITPNQAVKLKEVATI